MADPDAPRRLLKNAQREAVRTLIIWALALIWTVGWCWLFGYRHSPDSWLVHTGIVAARSDADFWQIAGLPDWVAIGIFLPWIVCTVLTVIISLWGMADDDLDLELDDVPPAPRRRGNLPELTDDAIQPGSSSNPDIRQKGDGDGP